MMNEHAGEEGGGDVIGVAYYSGGGGGGNYSMAPSCPIELDITYM